MKQEILQKIHAGSNRELTWLDIILLLSIIGFILSGITIVPFHGDEATYIWASRDYDRIVKQRNLDGIIFNPQTGLNDPEQMRRLLIGSVLEFAIGFTRDIAGNNAILNRNWNWNYPPEAGDLMWKKSIEQGRMPDPSSLILARIPSALMGSLSIIFLFLFARQLFASRLPAWTTIILFATHGDILVNFRRAMQEGPKFLFLALTLYLASYLLKGLKVGKTDKSLYCLLGIASGLTLASKQDTAPVLVAIYLALALIPVWKRDVGNIIFLNIFYLIAATSLAFASFLFAMPVFWGWWENIFILTGFVLILFYAPVRKVEKTAKLLVFVGCALIVGIAILLPSALPRFAIPVSSMIEAREKILDVQLNYSIKKHGLFYLDTVDNKAKFLIKTTLTSNVMYMEMPTFNIDPINEQIAIYESSLVRGRINSPTLDALIAILFVIGLWVLLRYFEMKSLLMLSLLLVPAVALFLFVPLPWQRYFLIMQIPYSLIVGTGTEQVWTWMMQSFGTGRPQ